MILPSSLPGHLDNSQRFIAGGLNKDFRRQAFTSRIAVQDLQQENLDCDDRRQDGLPPPHAFFPADFSNGFVAQLTGPLLLELTHKSAKIMYHF